jgi:gamma-glutamyl phosphate reductase
VTGREQITTLLKCGDLIDLVIPRGSNALVKYVKENTAIPVLGLLSSLLNIRAC